MNPFPRLSSSSPSRFFSSPPSAMPLSALSPSFSPLGRPPLSSPLLSPSLSPTLFPGSPAQVRSFFNKTTIEENLFDYFAPKRPAFFAPPSPLPPPLPYPSPSPYPQPEKIREVKKNEKPSFLELAKQLKPFSSALRDMVVWKGLMWNQSRKQPVGAPMTRRETMLSRVISQEFRTAAPYLVVFMLPFVGNFVLPACLLFVATTSPTSLPRLFWTERIHLRARQDLWRRKRETKQKVHQFLVRFVENNHDSLKTLDIFDVQKIKEGLEHLEGKDETQWEDGVSALIPFLESAQFIKSEFITGDKKNLFHSFNPTTKTHSYSESTFENLGKYLMKIDNLIEKTDVKKLPNKDVVWICEQRGFWGEKPLSGDDWIENLPFPDDEKRVERMRQKLENWLEISKVVRKSSPNLLTYYHLLTLFGGPYDGN